MTLRKSFLILLSLILAAVMLFAPFYSAQACESQKHSKRHPSSVRASKNPKKALYQSHKGKSKKQRKSAKLARTLPAKKAPPSRVRIIDTGSKTNSDNFPMPEINEWRASQHGSSDMSSQSPQDSSELTLE